MTSPRRPASQHGEAHPTAPVSITARTPDRADALVRREQPTGGAQTEPAAVELTAMLDLLRVAQDDMTAQVDDLMATLNAMEHARRRYHDLFEFAPDAYLVTNADGRIVEANAAAMRLIGRSRAHTYGRSLLSFMAPDSATAVAAAMRALAEAAVDRPATWELRVRSRGRGLYRIVHARVRVFVGRPERLTQLLWLLRRSPDEHQAEADAGADPAGAERGAPWPYGTGAGVAILRDADGRGPRLDPTAAALRAYHRVAATLAAEAAALSDDHAIARIAARLSVPAIADACHVYFVNADGAARLVAAGGRQQPGRPALVERGPRSIESDRHTHAIARVLGDGEPLLLVDEARDQTPSGIAERGSNESGRSDGVDSLLALPLVIAGDGVAGILLLSFADSGRRHGDHDLLLGRDLARQVSLLIQCTRLDHRLRSYAAGHHGSVERRPVALTAVLRQVIAERHRLDLDRPVDVFTHGAIPDALASPEHLHQAIDRLIRHADQTTPRHIPIHVRITTTGPAVVLTIAPAAGAGRRRLLREHPVPPEATLTPLRTLIDANGGTLEAGRGGVLTVTLPISIVPSGARGRTAGAPARMEQRVSRREGEVLRLLEQGLTNRQIAARLVLSERTIEHHISRMLARFRLSTRTHLAAHALKQGLIDGDPPREG